METGEFYIGTNEDNQKTGNGAAVRMIKVKHTIEPTDEHEEEQEVKLYYALPKNRLVYKVKEEDFVKAGFHDEKVEALKKEMDGKYNSYLGYDFGDVIPKTVTGYKAMMDYLFEGEMNDSELEAEMENGNIIFLGTEQDEDDEDKQVVRLCWALIEPKKEGSPMRQARMEKEEFVKCMFMPMESPKRMTVHYINDKDEKTDIAVNEMSEIKDMKEFLYQMNN